MYMVKWNRPRHLFLLEGYLDEDEIRFAMLVNDKVVKYTIQRFMDTEFNGLEGFTYVGVGDRWLTKSLKDANKVAFINDSEVEEVDDSLILI